MIRGNHRKEIRIGTTIHGRGSAFAALQERGAASVIGIADDSEGERDLAGSTTSHDSRSTEPLTPSSESSESALSEGVGGRATPIGCRVEGVVPETPIREEVARRGGVVPETPIREEVEIGDVVPETPIREEVARGGVVPETPTGEEVEDTDMSSVDSTPGGVVRRRLDEEMSSPEPVDSPSSRTGSDDREWSDITPPGGWRARALGRNRDSSMSL